MIFSRGSLGCHQATSLLCRPTLRGSAAKRCYTNLIPTRTPQEPTHKLGSSMTRTIHRVALRDPRWVSTVPLTISSPEHRTISLRASTESQATKPSRRWQPPRVTSTTGLQHEHLVPLLCNLSMQHTRITHSLLIRTLASTSELEPSTPQAWTLSPKGAQH